MINLRFPTLTLALALLCTLLAAPSATEAQDVPPLFVEVGAERPGPDSIRVRSRPGQIDFSILEGLLAGEYDRLRLNLFDDVDVVAQKERIQQWNASEYTWEGRVLDQPQSNVTLEVDTSKQLLVGTVTIEGQPYSIERVEGNAYVVHQIDPTPLYEKSRDYETDGDEDDESVPIEPGNDSVRIGGLLNTVTDGRGEEKVRPKAAADPEVIDVLILYTNRVSNAAGGTIIQEIRSAINEANRSFRDSGVNARLRAAAFAGVSYSKSGQRNMDDMLDALESNGNTNGDHVHDLREKYGADIVGMVITVGTGKAADIMGNVSTNFSDEAYFVTSRGNMRFGRTLAHEVGHLMGARHDRYVDGTDGSPFDYNHGFVNINSPNGNGNIGWRTIMAYNDECADQPGNNTNCNRINRWSDPDSTWTDGNSMGIASGSNAADNVRTLNNTASTVASFKSAMPVISGTVTDLVNGGGLEDVSLGGVYGPLSDASGHYERVIPKGDDVTISPSKGEYSFDPTSRSYTNVRSDQTGQDYNANITYLVQGRITDQAGNGLGGIEMGGAPPLSASTETNQFGFYQLKAQKGWSGTVTPQSAKYDFSPTSRSYSNLGADQRDDDYAAEIRTYTISGYVKESGTGNPIADANLDGFYPNDPRRTVTTDASGHYTVGNLEHGWSGTITPRKAGYNFQPYSTTYNSLSQDRQTDYFGTQQALANSSWPLFGAGPQRHRTAETDAVVNRVRWRGTLGDDATSAVVGSGGTVYVGAADGSVYAYADDGTQMWKSKAVRGDSVTASPAAGAGRLVYAPSYSGALTALNQRGAVEWNFFVGEPMYSSPLVDESGTLYVGTDDDSLYAVDATSGTRRWAVGTDGNVRSSPAASANGSTIYVGSDDDSLYAVSSSGTLRWTYGTGGDVRSSPAVDTVSGAVYVGSDDGSLHAVDAATGARKWRYQTGDKVRSSPAIGSSGAVYVGSDDGYLHAVDTTGGTRVWRYHIGGNVRSSPAIGKTRTRLLSPTLSGSNYKFFPTVFVGAADGKLYALDASPNASSRLRWTYDTGDAVNASPALGAQDNSENIKGGLYVGSDDDGLHALALQDEASANVSNLGYGVNFDLDRAHVVVWENERGGPLGLLGKIPEGDPCEGGPLIIPDCNRFGRFGGTSSPWRLAAGVELVFGLATGENVDPIISGESTEGLLGTTRATLEEGSTANLVLAGVAEPDAFADNPNGRSTELTLFRKDGLGDAAADAPEQVSVYAGHFSTDAPALRVTLQDGETTHEVGTLRYGDFSETKSVPPGEYEAIVEVMDAAASAGNATQASTASLTRTVDLTGRAGEPVGLLAGGFLNPDNNQNGPPLALHTATVDGPAPADGPKTRLDVRAWLQGPYDAETGRMRTALREGELLPARQPYGREIFDGTPKAYDGSETFDQTTPNLYVDWVLLELRSGTPGEGMTVEARTAALLRPDGSVVSPIDGERLPAVAGLTKGEYYLVLRHRDHLPVMSREPIPLDGAPSDDLPPLPYDLTGGPDAVYNPGALVELAGGEAYGLAGGDGDASGAVGNADVFSVWLDERGLDGYLQGDYDLSGSAGNGDLFTIWSASRGRAADLPAAEPPAAQDELATTKALAQASTATSTATDGITYTIQNAQVTTDSGHRYLEFDVMLYANGAAASPMTNARAVLTYDPAAFGSGDLVSKGRISVSDGTLFKSEDCITQAAFGADGRLTIDQTYSVSGLLNPADSPCYDNSAAPVRSLSLPSSDAPQQMAHVRMQIADPDLGADLRFVPAQMQADNLDDTFQSYSSVGATGSYDKPLPVELAHFEARADEERVRLVWQTASETNNTGFEIHRKQGNAGAHAWRKIGFTESKASGGTTSETISYRFTDRQLPYEADRLVYRLSQIDTDGTTTVSDPVTVVRTAERFELEKIFPNPAHEQATVHFAVPEAGEVRLRLFDALGRSVRTVFQAQAEGRRELQVDLSGLSSGTYFFQLRADGQTKTRRVTVVR